MCVCARVCVWLLRTVLCLQGPGGCAVIKTHTKVQCFWRQSRSKANTFWDLTCCQLETVQNKDIHNDVIVGTVGKSNLILFSCGKAAQQLSYVIHTYRKTTHIHTVQTAVTFFHNVVKSHWLGELRAAVECHEYFNALRP